MMHCWPSDRCDTITLLYEVFDELLWEVLFKVGILDGNTVYPKSRNSFIILVI